MRYFDGAAFRENFPDTPDLSRNELGGSRRWLPAVREHEAAYAMLNVWLGIWLLLNVFAASPSVSARKLHHESRQSDLEPDYASRRRIRDVEADREGEGGGEAEAEAGAAADANMRFIETHRQLDSPQSEDEVEANAVKAKLMMQAESLGISNPDNYAQSVVQQAVDQEIVSLTLEAWTFCVLFWFRVLV